MKVTAILKGRKDEKDRISIQIRVNIGKVRRFYPLKIKVRKNQFSKGKVINHPNAFVFNSVIKAEIQKREVSEAVSKGVDPDFFEYTKHCIIRWREMRLKKESTLKQYESELNKISSFKSSFRLSDMNNSWFSGFLAHCYKLGNKENTAWKTFAKIHAILEQAIKDDILLKNPMDKFTDAPKYRNPKRNFLTFEQVQSIEKFMKVATPEQKFSCAWFLIGCYTGLRISDMRAFNKKNIIGGRLIIHTTKTNELVSLPVRGKIKELLEVVKYKPLSITNEAYNRMLKVIAEKCEIEFNLVAHSSRHTAAMMLMNTGASLDEVAAILGHTNTKHTAIYAKINNSRIDKAIDKIITTTKARQ